MSTIAEIVQFTVLPQTDPAGFVEAARQTARWLASCPGYLGRTLSQGEDGAWTDHVLWSDMGQAIAAAEALMAAPAAQEMLRVIDPASVRMRHEVVRLTRDG